MLSAYPRLRGLERVEALGNAGGFSGASLWRVWTAEGTFCLRRWPREYPSQGQLEFVHAVLGHVAAKGFGLAPIPLETRRRNTFVRHEGHLWELTPWMPGESDLGRPPEVGRLRGAMEALRAFHAACQDFPLAGPLWGRSPGIARRSDQLARWLSGGLDRLRQSIQPGIWPELADRAHRICELVRSAGPIAAGLLLRAADVVTRMQPCMGDVWRDHVLFEGNRVSGLIDFGSMRVDNAAADVARLLGSMAEDDEGLWAAGLESYEAAGPMSPEERLLVEAFDRSTVVMSGINWVVWIYQERRAFEAVAEIPSRLDGIIRRLEGLRGSGVVE